jgi:hypothetical protein
MEIIAMGASGTTVAHETADVALMADELDRVPVAINLARREIHTVQQNVALSLVTVFALVAAALAGWLTLKTGLLLNEGGALLIIANGLRLLRPAHNPAHPRERDRRSGRHARHHEPNGMSIGAGLLTLGRSQRSRRLSAHLIAFSSVWAPVSRMSMACS